MNLNEVLKRMIKYMIEGIFVAIAAYTIPKKKLDVEEVLVVGLMGACTFAVLDVFVPAIGQSTRQGAGMGIGFNLVGFPGGGPVL
jgi:hypothetical protein